MQLRMNSRPVEKQMIGHHILLPLTGAVVLKTAGLTEIRGRTRLHELGRGQGFEVLAESKR